jgi:hypothetical protein
MKVRYRNEGRNMIAQNIVLALRCLRVVDLYQVYGHVMHILEHIVIILA